MDEEKDYSILIEKKQENVPSNIDHCSTNRQLELECAMVGDI